MQYPKDKYIIPISVPAIVVLVSALNNDPLPQLISQGWFWRDVSAGSLVAGFVWLCVRFISIRLDNKLGCKHSFPKRLLWQCIFGWLGPSVILFGLCWLMFEFVIGQPMFQTLFPYYEYPFSVMLIAVINGYYLIYNLLQTEKIEIAVEQIEQDVSNTTLFAYKGADRFPLHHAMIGVVIKNNTYLDVYTTEGKRLNMSGTMESLEKVLPDDTFFRVNRQVIMHVKSIKSFRSIENGKIEIACGLDGIDAPIVSQKKAADFRKWIDASFANLN